MVKYKDGDWRFEINIVDLGGMVLVLFGVVVWIMLDVDCEMDDGYEWIIIIDGYKVYEKFDSWRGEVEIFIFYKDCFLVNIKGDNFKKGDVEKIFDWLDFDDLDDL